MNTPCCPEWEHATEAASDKESFGRAIVPNGELFYISRNLPPLVFCPWCASRKRQCPLCRGTGHIDSQGINGINSVPCPHCWCLHGERTAELIAAYIAFKEAEKLAEEHLEESRLCGYSNDPTGSLHVTETLARASTQWEVFIAKMESIAKATQA